MNPGSWKEGIIVIKDEVLLTVSCPIFPSILIAIDRDRDSLILSVRTDYFVEIHEKITIEELINH
jgi:hypothetical protein